ncbi:uncharacterized protein [Parasteatoda tepidariorum]|uniref:uncharacterized protein n=1 Tax=Parasteatoda tepidariorum TaxID=114398 RepID=UPI001C71DE65|nr:uncharacterized protein LOC107449164 [Parasteatoda tepidariorum]
MAEYLTEYFNVDEKRFLLAYSAKANNITDTTFDGILHHIYYNAVYNDVETIDNVLKVIKELKLDLWSMFKQKLPGSNDFSNYSLLKSPKAFIRITEAGASNGFTKAIRYQVQLWSDFMGWFLNDQENHTWVEKANYISGNPLHFRALQLLNLYLRFIYRGKFAELEMVVRVLWSSIPDPLLTMDDISRPFEGINLIPYQNINSVWKFYCSLVNYEETSVRRPRSLQHLSRFFIRNRLRDNFKLPEGVEELGIPKHVQKYLLLRDFYKIE